MDNTHSVYYPWLTSAFEATLNTGISRKWAYLRPREYGKRRHTKVAKFVCKQYST